MQGDLIKFMSDGRMIGVPVMECIGMKIGEIVPYMDKEFDGFYRPTEGKQ